MPREEEVDVEQGTALGFVAVLVHVWMGLVFKAIIEDPCLDICVFVCGLQSEYIGG